MTLFSSPKISLCIARLNKVIRGGPVSQRLCGFLLYEERNTISVAVFGAHAKWQTDTRACVCRWRPSGNDRSLSPSAPCPTPTISRPDERSQRPSNLHRRMADRRPIDPRRAAVCPRQPASSRDCLYTANNAQSTVGLTSEGLDEPSDWRTDGQGGTVVAVKARQLHCCNNYEPLSDSYCCQVCRRCWISHLMTTVSIDSTPTRHVYFKQTSPSRHLATTTHSMKLHTCRMNYGTFVPTYFRS